MRLTSYQKLLWMITLLAASSIAMSAQIPAGETQNANSSRTDTQAQQRQTMSVESSTQTTVDAGPRTPGPPAEASGNNSARPGGRVETASIFPDSASLLPVAAVVGFSFLLGGIVCGTIKSRH